MKKYFYKKETEFQKQGSAASFKKMFYERAIAHLNLNSHGKV